MFLCTFPNQFYFLHRQRNNKPHGRTFPRVCVCVCVYPLCLRSEYVQSKHCCCTDVHGDFNKLYSHTTYIPPKCNTRCIPPLQRVSFVSIRRRRRPCGCINASTRHYRYARRLFSAESTISKKKKKITWFLSFFCFFFNCAVFSHRGDLISIDFKGASSIY